MSVSSGALLNRYYGEKPHTCALKLVTRGPDEEDIPLFCPYITRSHFGPNKNRGSGRYKNRQYKNTRKKGTPSFSHSEITETDDLNLQTISESDCENDLIPSPQSVEEFEDDL